jgi:chromosomal replication initiator protein
MEMPSVSHIILPETFIDDWALTLRRRNLRKDKNVNAQDAWNAAYVQLELQLDRPTFEMWVRGAVLLHVEQSGDQDVFVIGAKNPTAREMLSQKLYRNVRRLVSDCYGKPVELRFEVAKKTAPAVAATADDMPLFRLMAEQQSSLFAPSVDTASQPASTPNLLHQLITRPKAKELPENTLIEAYTFDRFVPGTINQIVYTAARAVAEQPSGDYSPFFIYGDVGLGKTHLLHAIAHVCRARGLRVVYIPAEAFTNDLIESIRGKATAMFRERYRSADVLLVDDVQFWAGKETTQEEFFHTYNALQGAHKQIVLAADKPPRDLTTLEARLRSRFEAGLAMHLQLPDLETRVAILRLWAEEMGVALSPEIAYRVAESTTSHLREMQGIFKKMTMQARATGEALTLDDATHEVQRFRMPRYHTVTIDQVMEVTARHYGLDSTDLISAKRAGQINTARQIAMYLARELTSASLHQIGAAFGGRKHSTVLYSCQSVAHDLDCDPIFASILQDIRKRLIRGA